MVGGQLPKGFGTGLWQRARRMTMRPPFCNPRARLRGSHGAQAASAVEQLPLSC
jgi:hypothetical protein